MIGIRDKRGPLEALKDSAHAAQHPSFAHCKTYRGCAERKVRRENLSPAGASRRLTTVEHFTRIPHGENHGRPKNPKKPAHYFSGARHRAMSLRESWLFYKFIALRAGKSERAVQIAAA
jgi:hypothetical protein